MSQISDLCHIQGVFSRQPGRAGARYTGHV
jgi:hypothetical protein